MPSPRDIVVMGASAGGLEALTAVVSGLPSALAAAVFVVLHQPDSFRSPLAELLQKRTKLRVEEALHGDSIEHGRVYVAPPDNHLLVRQGQIEVVRGPRENGHRPAVNALFRTAANVYGPRVVGVVLTGALDCGTFGLLSIKAKRGVGIAQNPRTAFCGDMPRSAIESGAVDIVVELDEIAPTIVKLVAEGSSDAMAETVHAVGQASFVTCPLCNGSMTETGHGTTTEFACHIGHTFSLRSLYAEQADEVERAFWAAIRALEESASLARRLSDTSTGSLRSRFQEKERTMRQHAATLRRMVLEGTDSTRADVAPESDDDSKA
jgi:two-component system chemotaxis response regulator CheB